MKELTCCALNVGSNITLYHSGPPLDLGPLPSFFYFSLSGPDSLCLDPFNQPVQFLHGEMIRIFSMTLPGHENNLPPTKAMQIWADDYKHKRDPIENFLNDLARAVDFAIEENFVDSSKMAIGGLSRGGLIALHAAARNPKFKFILCFAPITELHRVKEFADLQDDPVVRFFDARNLKTDLCDRSLRFYISNHDTLVDTSACFHFAMQLVDEAVKAEIRSPKIELSLHPAIGHKGHGTPPEIFRHGALWIADCLKHTGSN